MHNSKCFVCINSFTLEQPSETEMIIVHFLDTETEVKKGQAIA